MLFVSIFAKFGPNIDGKLMGAFHVSCKRETVYFLWDPNTGFITRCDEVGKRLSSYDWLDMTSQQFVRMHWNGKVSALSKIYVMGRSLKEYYRECLRMILA